TGGVGGAKGVMRVLGGLAKMLFCEMTVWSFWLWSLGFGPPHHDSRAVVEDRVLEHRRDGERPRGRLVHDPCTRVVVVGDRVARDRGDRIGRRTNRRGVLTVEDAVERVAAIRYDNQAVEAAADRVVAGRGVARVKDDAVEPVVEERVPGDQGGGGEGAREVVDADVVGGDDVVACDRGAGPSEVDDAGGGTIVEQVGPARSARRRPPFELVEADRVAADRRRGAIDDRNAVLGD